MTTSRRLGSRLLFPETKQPIDVRPAASRDELEEAYALVYRSYLWRGYIPPNDSGLRLSLFNLLPDAVTFAGAYDGGVVATVSLIPDSPAGLPMDDIYHTELSALRAQNRRIAEVTMLADRRLEIRRTLPMLLALMKLLFDYAIMMLECTDLCITINPRHNDFYERYLLFTHLGDLKHYPSVQNNPALARRLDLTQVRERCEGHELLLRLFFDERTDREVFLNRFRMSDDDVAHFCGRTSIVAEASQPLFDLVRGQYPQLPFDAWRNRT